MKRVLKYVLLIIFISLLVLFLNQSTVNAETLKRINTIDDLREALGGNVTINGNTLILNENITITDEMIISIPEIIIDFNGKTLNSGMITIQGKATFKDTLGGGGMHFKKMYGGVTVEKNAELNIDNGKYEDSGVSYMFIIKGKLVINDGDFISTENNPDNVSRKMIDLYKESETIINGGNFVDTDTIINSLLGNYKLTINGGSFKGTGEFAPISIVAAYPYLISQGVESSVFPTVIFNDCNVEGKKVAVFITCGTSNEELANIKDKAITFNGGTYKCRERWICC